MKTVIGLYDDVNTAQQVVNELVDGGFDRNQISIVANNGSGQTMTTTAGSTRSTGEDVSSGEGAGIGALEGGAIGLLAGIGAMAIPGIGPVLAAGPLIGALAGAGVGALTGGLVAGMIDSGIPEDLAGHYAEGVRRGGTLVSVITSDEWAQEAANIMNDYGAIDVEQRASNWQQEGYTGFDANAAPYSSSQTTATRSTTPTTQTTQTTQTTASRPATTQTTNAQGEVRLPVVQEELHVGKRQVESGGVRVHTHVKEVPVQESVKLREERVTVERRPVDRAVTSADMANMKDTTIELTETSEQAVVQKSARVVEEVVVGKQVGERTETINETLRHTDVEVQQMAPAATARTTTTTFSSYEPTFRTNFDSTYMSRGQKYESYRPAYEYGYTLASDQRYQGREWSAIEKDARRDWDSRGQGTWADFKDAVRYAWDEVRGRR